MNRGGERWRRVKRMGGREGGGGRRWEYNLLCGREGKLMSRLLFRPAVVHIVRLKGRSQQSNKWMSGQGKQGMD